MANFTQPYVVGLTGGIGSGKSTVSENFHTCGAKIIDADAVSHQITAPKMPALTQIVETFGAAIITKEGKLNRAALREIVFQNPQQRQRLESILHPLIRAEMQNQLQQAGATPAVPYVIWMVPLLLESAQSRAVCQRIAVVDCSVETQIARVMARSALRPAEVEKIIAAQISRSDRLALADDVIDNSGEIAKIAPQVALLDTKYRQLAQQFHRL